jgi:preprotein translocase subunit SecA
MRGLERWQVTRSIDDYWMEHLAEMDYLRDAIWQEGYAQKEPIGVYRQEGFALFQKMLGEIRREVTEGLFSFEAQTAQTYGGPELMDVHEARLMQSLPMDEDGLDDGVQLFKDADGDDEDDAAMMHAPAAFAPSSTAVATAASSTRNSAKVGRNHPCPCGSGKKYKNCCLPKEK